MKGLNPMRENLRTTARRIYLSVSRAVLTKSDDAKLMQEVDIEVSKGEAHTGVEHWQGYGLSTRPKAPTDDKHAEALVAYVGGSRSHPVVIAIADRRSRPKNLAEGEVCLHDSGDQKVLLSAGGIVVSSGTKITFTVGGTSVVVMPDKVLLGGAGATKRVKLEDDSIATKVFAL
jgi:phage gp45-like